MKVRWRLSPAGWDIMGERWTMETVERQNIEDWGADLKRRTSKSFGESIIEQIIEAKERWRRQ